jgi:cell division topological specificity factor
MDWLGFFRSKKPPSAQTARDRLMMVVAVQRDQDGRRSPTAVASALSYLPQLREELLAVVRKYVPVPDTAVQVNVQKEAGLEVLEMNISLPEGATRLS